MTDDRFIPVHDGSGWMVVDTLDHEVIARSGREPNLLVDALNHFARQVATATDAAATVEALDEDILARTVYDEIIDPVNWYDAAELATLLASEGVPTDASRVRVSFAFLTGLGLVDTMAGGNSTNDKARRSLPATWIGKDQFRA